LKKGTITVTGLTAASAPSAPTPLGVTGADYEISVFSKYTSSPAIAQALENLMADVYSDFQNGRTVLGAGALAAFELYVRAQSALNHIQPPAAQTLNEFAAGIGGYILGKVVQSAESLL
jgi:hypothetical protein